MNTAASNLNGARWKTYLAAAAFSVPALFFWTVSIVIILPKVKEVLASRGHDGSELGWLWTNPLFLISNGRVILVSILVVFALLELFSRGWPRYRRVGVGILAWLLNVAVLYGLTLLVLSLLWGGPGLPRA